MRRIIFVATRSVNSKNSHVSGLTRLLVRGGERSSWPFEELLSVSRMDRGLGLMVSRWSEVSHVETYVEPYIPEQVSQPLTALKLARSACVRPPLDLISFRDTFARSFRRHT